MSSTERFTNLPIEKAIPPESFANALTRSHFTVAPNTLVSDIVRLLSMQECAYCHCSISKSVRQHQNCVLVVENSHLVGIFTESDAVKLMALQVDFSTIEIAEVMQYQIISLTQNHSTNILAALSLLREHDISHLPVLDEQGLLLGVITEASLLEVLSIKFEEQTAVVRELNAVKESLRQAEAEIERRVEERTYKLLHANVQLQQEMMERNRVSSALRESEERFRTMADTAPVMIWVAGTDKLCNYFNKGWLEFTGHTLEEEIGSGWVSRVHPDDYGYYLDIYLTSFEARQPFSMEYRLQRHDSEYRWILDRGTPRFNMDGSFAGYIGSCIDISDRKLAEQKISEQAALLDVATDAIFVRGLDTEILYWNQGAERLYGWSAQEVIGKSANRLLYRDLLQLETALKTVAETGDWKGELNKIHKNGKDIIVESHWTMVFDAAGKQKFILTVDTDITDKKLLEAQFLRAQRLESLGILASGIAHDLNNILTPILAIAQLLPLTLPKIDERNQNMLQILETNTKRGADLVKQILSFARGAQGKRTLIQVKHLIVDIEKIAKGTFPKSIEIERCIPDTLWMVKGDATQLHQVFMNLAVNARDAMPNGGTLSITAENHLIDTNYAAMNIEAKVGAYVAVTFRDTGVGISNENLDKIFDPFFTTKEIGKGTGLGLSTVHSIIKNHRGFVEVRSQVNKGSSFRVYLAASKHTARVAAENLELAEGNGELILFVDDEVAISEIAKNTLETHNYRVLVADNGIEAIALYAQHKHQIKAVVMDLIMPSLDGITAIRALQKMNPQVPIIIMSGTSETIRAHSIEEVQGFLEKPFTTKHLLTSLRNAIVRN